MYLKEQLNLLWSVAMHRHVCILCMIWCVFHSYSACAPIPTLAIVSHNLTIFVHLVPKSYKTWWNYACINVKEVLSPSSCSSLQCLNTKEAVKQTKKQTSLQTPSFILENGCFRSKVHSKFTIASYTISNLYIPILCINKLYYFALYSAKKKEKASQDPLSKVTWDGWCTCCYYPLYRHCELV